MKESKTYCLKDYKNNHCWTSIGIYQNRGIQDTIIEVFKCEQCGKIIRKELKEINSINI